MAKFQQQNRPIEVSTPLGKDVLLLVGYNARESISQLFNFQLDLLAEKTADVAFDKLLGQKITIRQGLPGSGKNRFFNGICNRISQGEQDEDFTSYRMELVPQFWLLTRKAQSRIFQHISVPDILKKVLDGLDVSFDIKGTFEKRDYCVQYRETDFNFASRLMEEEGIFYFFKHENGSHKMMVANTPPAHQDLGKFTYENITGGTRPDDRIFDWQKTQEMRSGKYTLWDHTFELPHKHLETDKTIQESVTVGKVDHKLKVGGNDKLEIFDYPGEYAQRFDGIDRSGGEQASELQKVFQDNKRTVEIRMQEEAVGSLVINGAGNVRNLAAGSKFSLEKHFNADGQYVLTSVQHDASTIGAFRSGGDEFHFQSSFSCIPTAIPFRPARLTPRPFVQGTQSAVVVGPANEEIFTDKYSRVKVQFHWDREGKNDGDSSCWVRVGTSWAGKQWGAISIPRIGQEVVVAFQEGDPDQPIIVGSVFNAEMMPPYKLPDNKTQSGIKTRSTLKGGPENFNELRFEDKKGSEEITLHAERNFSTTVEHDESVHVFHNRTVTIGGSKHNKDPKKDGTHTETIEGDVKITVQKGDYSLEVQEGKSSTKVKKTVSIESTDADIVLTAKTEIKLKVGASELVMKADGTINLSGVNVTVKGSAAVTTDAVVTNTVKGGVVKINC